MRLYGALTVGGRPPWPNWPPARYARPEHISMSVLMKSMFLALLALVLFPAATQAATVYPLDQAEILSGSRFDVKVEFSSRLPDPNAARLTINGRDAAQVLGKQPQFVPDEDGKGSALILRGASLPAGAYTVEARGGDAETARVSWQVYATPKPVAKNVILLIADGLSVGHRTAARLLSTGMTQGKYNGRLAMDTMPHMATVGTAA